MSNANGRQVALYFLLLSAQLNSLCAAFKLPFKVDKNMDISQSFATKDATSHQPKSLARHVKKLQLEESESQVSFDEIKDYKNDVKLPEYLYRNSMPLMEDNPIETVLSQLGYPLGNGYFNELGTHRNNAYLNLEDPLFYGNNHGDNTHWNAAVQTQQAAGDAEKVEIPKPALVCWWQSDIAPNALRYGD